MRRPNAEVAAVIAITDGTVQETRERLDEMDRAATARRLAQEIAERTTNFKSPELITRVQVELIVSEKERHPFVLTVGAGETVIETGRLDGAPVYISQDFAEMLRDVYGASAVRSDSTRKVWILDEPGPASDDPKDPWRERSRAATIAAGQVLEAISGQEENLGALARRLGTDKWGLHFYTPHYETHFSAYRDQRIILLEIGVGGYESPHRGGESLRMWREYFRRGLIYGLDLHDKSSLDRPRMETVRGDQSDPHTLAAMVTEIGPLDIVIDDGSHLSDHVLTSFTEIFPHLNSGGIYVIEDLQTAYWPDWNGERNDLNDPQITTGFLKTLFDGLHHQDRMSTPATALTEIERQIRAIHLYHNIAFIEKGLNAEQGAPSWIRGDATAAPARGGAFSTNPSADLPE
jgi:demethylmacrocin O-methyltransferase